MKSKLTIFLIFNISLFAPIFFGIDDVETRKRWTEESFITASVKFQYLDQQTVLECPLSTLERWTEKLVSRQLSKIFVIQDEELVEFLIPDQNIVSRDKKTGGTSVNRLLRELKEEHSQWGEARKKFREEQKLLNKQESKLFGQDFIELFEETIDDDPSEKKTLPRKNSAAELTSPKSKKGKQLEAMERLSNPSGRWHQPHRR